MKLKELVLKTSWNAVKSSLFQIYPESERGIGKFKGVFEALLTLSPRETKMRLCLKEVLGEGIDEEPYVEVYGKDGTLNKDLPDFHHFSETASTEFANSETSFAIDLVPWEEWLGMELDPSALQAYSDSDILAHCLWEMTFFGFDQLAIEKQREEIDRQVMEFKNMSEEEKKSMLIPWEEVIEELQDHSAQSRTKPERK
jgi:hypothetical protein